MADKHSIDMTEGPLLPQIISFSLPLMASALLQMVFNTADLIVVGRFCSHQSLAAIGATGPLNQIIIGAFLGLAGGANVLTANSFGAKNTPRTIAAVHTAIAIALYGGIILGCTTPLLVRPLLVLMKTPPEVLDGATLYMQIICGGIPFISLYNFGSALMRSFGDSRRPMNYLAAAGVLNVLLNLFFVLALRLDVAGVAWATILSQAVSAFLVLRSLARMSDAWRLQVNRISLDFKMMRGIIRIGLPNGIQTSFFAMTNMLIQSSVNSLGEKAMAGSAAAGNIEAYVAVIDIAAILAGMSFVGQNKGARKYHRLCQSIKYNLYCSLAANVVLSWAVLLVGRPLLSIYNGDPEVIDWGYQRMFVMLASYVLVITMDSIAGALRGLEHAWMPMVSTFVGVCGFRTIWILTIFKRYRTMSVLMMSYTFSWGIVALVTGTYLYIQCRRLLRRDDCAD